MQEREIILPMSLVGQKSQPKVGKILLPNQNVSQDLAVDISYDKYHVNQSFEQRQKQRDKFSY